MVVLQQLLVLLFLLGVAHWAFTRGKRDDVSADVRTQFSAMQGALLGLLGLQLGFLASMAEGRFSDRRHLIMREANAIGTLYLRSDFFGPERSLAVRDLIRSYTDARIAFYEAGSDEAAEARAVADSRRLQDQIWKHAVALTSSAEDVRRATLFVNVANDVIDLEAERRVALETHLPRSLVWMLLLVAAVAIWTLSYGWGLARKRSLLGVWVLPVLIGLAIGVVLDLDSPRVGILRVGQRAMLETRAAMDPSTTSPTASDK